MGFYSGSDMKDHMTSKHCAFHMKQVLKMKETELDTKKRLNLKSTIFKMKEKELKENVVCKCNFFCRIFHPKHNWQKYPSEEFERKLEELLRCSESPKWGSIGSISSCTSRGSVKDIL